MSKNHADYRELANEAYNEGCMADALECLKIAYELAVLEFGMPIEKEREELADDYVAFGGFFSWSVYKDDAFYYYKSAYELVVA